MAAPRRRPCPRCELRQSPELFIPGNEYCAPCRIGDFRAVPKEYSTSLDMRMAAVFAHVSLTRAGVSLALERLKTLPPLPEAYILVEMD